MNTHIYPPNVSLVNLPFAPEGRQAVIDNLHRANDVLEENGYDQLDVVLDDPNNRYTVNIPNFYVFYYALMKAFPLAIESQYHPDVVIAFYSIFKPNTDNVTSNAMRLYLLLSVQGRNIEMNTARPLFRGVILETIGHAGGFEAMFPNRQEDVMRITQDNEMTQPEFYRLVRKYYMHLNSHMLYRAVGPEVFKQVAAFSTEGNMEDFTPGVAEIAAEDVQARMLGELADDTELIERICNRCVIT